MYIYYHDYPIIEMQHKQCIIPYLSTYLHSCCVSKKKFSHLDKLVLVCTTTFGCPYSLNTCIYNYILKKLAPYTHNNMIDLSSKCNSNNIS